MNPWLDRFAGAIELPDGMTREEAAGVLDLAGVTARGAGARQFAPLATYLAGRAAATRDPGERAALLRRAAELAGQIGAAEEPLGID